MDKHLYKTLLQAQSDEITEHYIYLRLAAREKELPNRKVLERIAAEEKDHYGIWKNHTGKRVAPSMSASEYLSTRTEEDNSKHPVKAALYTGVTYVLTVALLIAPYLFLDNSILALGLSLGFAILVILLFTFYISVAKELCFTKRFFEIAGLSLTVAAISFGVGFLVKKFFNPGI